MFYWLLVSEPVCFYEINKFDEYLCVWLHAWIPGHICTSRYDLKLYVSSWTSRLQHSPECLARWAHQRFVDLSSFYKYISEVQDETDISLNSWISYLLTHTCLGSNYVHNNINIVWTPCWNPDLVNNYTFFPSFSLSSEGLDSNDQHFGGICIGTWFATVRPITVPLLS